MFKDFSTVSPTGILLIEKEAGIATLTLNRPDAMNALSRDLRRALVSAFHNLQLDADVRVAILTGAGRAFCAGLDLKEMGSGASDEPASASEDVMGAIDAFEGPIIGAINGHAVTGGFELALACDILIASTGARFADTHARVGLLPGWGLSQKLSRLIGVQRAKEMCFTGNYVAADQALAWGLVNRVVAPEALLLTCRELAAEMASCDGLVLSGYKRLIDEGFGMTFADAMAYERRVAVQWMSGVTAGQIAARREGVVDRGREQNRR